MLFHKIWLQKIRLKLLSHYASYIPHQKENETTMSLWVQWQDVRSLSWVTPACDPCGSINVMEQHWGLLGWNMFAICWPAHSKLRAESGDLSEDIGLLTLRVEDTAWGWFHRAATTSHSQQWRDHRLQQSQSPNGLVSLICLDHHFFFCQNLSEMSL